MLAHLSPATELICADFSQVAIRHLLQLLMIVVNFAAHQLLRMPQNFHSWRPQSLTSQKLPAGVRVLGKATQEAHPTLGVGALKLHLNWALAPINICSA